MPDVIAGQVVDFPDIPTPDLGADTVALPSDTSYEITLDDEPDTMAMPVHAGDAITVLPDAEHRLPIIPQHLQTLDGIKKAVARHADRARHHALYHAVRSPVYMVLAVVWAVVGVARILQAQLSWWWVAEQTYLRSEAVAAGDHRAWLTLHNHAQETRKIRGAILAAEAVGITIGVGCMVALAPWWVQALVAAVALPLLARLGRPADKPIVRPATVTPRFRKLSADVVLRAYYAAGLGNPDKPRQDITFGTPMARDGDGSRVVIDLPYGKGFDDALKAKAAIASGLDVSVNQVFLSKDPSSHRRHVLWVADRDPLAIPAGRTPLLDCKPRSIWQPAPFGLDERGRAVSVPMMWQSILVGSQPRRGKTFSVRLLALYAALDPYVTLSIIDGKASPDWTPLKRVCHHFIRGTHPHRDGDPVDQTLRALREIKKHIQGVNDFLTTLPLSVCPEGKITPELSHKYHQLRVWLVVLEEFQEYYELDDQEANKEIAALLSFIKAVGPSAGVILLSASQKPSGVGAGDVGRLFNRFRDNHAIRFALRCGNRLVSEAVLGGDAYAEGYDASALPRGDAYRGVGYLYGLGDDTPTVRCHLADGPDAEKIIKAARRYREQAGTLTGMAAGHAVATPDRDVLADVVSVFDSDAGLHWPTLAERLAGRYPDRWAGATGDSVSADVRALGVPSVDVKASGVNRKGCRRADVEALAR